MRQPRYSEIFAGHDDGGALAEMARVLWVKYRADLEGRGLWTDARGEAVDRLVRAVVEYQHLYPQAVAAGPVATADSGNMYFNYLWSAVQKLSDQIGKLEKALLLTPESVGGKPDPRKPQQFAAPADEFLGQH